MESILKSSEHLNRLHRSSHRLSFIRQIIFLVPVLLPLGVLMVLDPESFVLGWNEGRGGLLFAVFFLGLEWADSWRELDLKFDRRTLTGWGISLLWVSSYFVSVYLFKLYDSVAKVGKDLGIPGKLSWITMWEYFVFAAFLVGLLASSYGIRRMKKFPTAIVYLGGMACVLFLDAMFPYESLGILQGVVPIIIEIVLVLLWLSGFHVSRIPVANAPRPWVYVTGNALVVAGDHGTAVLQINWPCVGVLSMLVYSLIIVVLMIKLDAPLRRKIVYVILGAVGTFFVNVFRIFLISYYVTIVSFERLRIFHETIGEALFLVWILTFLIVVVQLEAVKAKSVTRALDTQAAGLRFRIQP